MFPLRTFFSGNMSLYLNISVKCSISAFQNFVAKIKSRYLRGFFFRPWMIIFVFYVYGYLVAYFLMLLLSVCVGICWLVW